MIPFRKSIFFVVCVILISICIFALWRVEIISAHYTYKYNKEINFLKEYVSLLSEGNGKKLSQNSYSESFLYNNKTFALYHRFINEVDISSLLVLRVDEIVENNEKMTIIVVSFQNNYRLYMDVKLRNQNKKMVVDSIMFSDLWKTNSGF